MDLTECVLMDSTFLGVLAGLGLKMSGGKKAEEQEHSIELLNPNPRIAELLENLGVLHLFHVITGPQPEMRRRAIDRTSHGHARACIARRGHQQLPRSPQDFDVH